MPATAALSIDATSAPGKPVSFSTQLKLILKRIQKQLPVVSRIEVTLHQVPGSTLRACSAFSKPNTRHGVQGREVTQKFWITHGSAQSRHRQDPDFMADYGAQSVLRIPLKVDEKLWGAVFFTAQKKHGFTPGIIEQLHVYARVITQLVASTHCSADQLDSTISAILRLNKASNSESPDHLKRVAHYSRLVAENCATTYSLSRQWIERLFLFAPLHDIGKIFMPEELLAKPGPLSPVEFAQMKTHTLKGREIIDHMIDSFGYQEDIHHTDMLRNIIALHHEAIDGSGYPFGLKNHEIPLEARIVAAADVLDALMTKRPYKDAWSVDKSIRKLRTLAGNRLDPEFVEILASSREELLEIRAACTPAAPETQGKQPPT